MSDDAPVGRHDAAQCRKDLRGNRHAAGNRRMLLASKERARLRLMFDNKFTHLVDGADAVQVTFALGFAPGKQTVTAEQRSVAAGIAPDRLLQLQSKLESRTLPGNPDDLAIKFAIEFLELLLSIGTRCDRDCPVRMQVIDMIERKKCMQAAYRWKQRLCCG